MNAADKREIAKLVKAMEAIKERIGKDRDDLRDLLDEYEEIINCSERATEGIESAVDALSEYL